MSKNIQRDTNDFVITPIEKMYQEHLNQLTGMEKMIKAQSLCDGMWEVLAHQIYQEKGNLSERDLHYYVAKRLYINDTKYLKFIEDYYNGY